MSRRKQRQIWSDVEFLERLKKIKAHRVIEGNPADSFGQLTYELIQCPSFEELEKELINFGKKIIKVKFDKKRGLI